MASLALAFDILARDKASKTFDKVGDSADRTGGKLDGLGGKFASFGKAAALGAGAAVVGLFALGNEVLNTGAQLGAWRQKTDVVFEGQAKSVRKWADANNEAFGLTDDNLAGLAAGFGDLLKPMGFTSNEAADMAKKVIGLSGALSSWSGGQRSAAEVSDILAKAMLGERESLKELGISITDADVKTRLAAKGQDKLTGAALEQAKALATQELIFEKSTDAQKAWAEGGNKALTASNKLKAGIGELKEWMADKLLPAALTVSEWIGERLPGVIASATPIVEGLGGFFGDVGRDIAAFVDDAEPKIEEFIRDVLEALKKWWDDNGPAITTAMEGFAEDVKDYILAPLGEVAVFIAETVIPALGTVITWILENKSVLEGLGTLVGVTLVAHFARLAIAAVASAASTAAAWASAVLPIVAMIALVGALVAVTNWAINTDAFKGFLGFFADVANAASRLAGFLASIIPQIGAMVALARAALGFVDKLPGGPSRAKVDPLTGRKIPEVHKGGTVMPWGIEPLRSDERYAKLQVGETVLPKGADNSRHIGQLVVQTTASPRAWMDEFMWQKAGL